MQRAAGAVQSVELAYLGAEQPAHPVRDRAADLARVRSGGDLLGESGQARQRIHAAALLVVQLGVLDRARDERGDVNQELERVLGELARSLGVENDHADRLPGAREDRNRGHRLEPLLVEDREELRARVGHRALADELGLAVPGHPSGEPLVETHLDDADGVGIDGRRRPDRQPAVFEQVDEARVTPGRLGGEVDDPLQHRAEFDRRADEVDHPVESPVLFTKPTGLRGGRQKCLPMRVSLCAKRTS
jgi:hypothetical protein